MNSSGHVKRTKARHRDRLHQYSAYKEPLSGRVTRLHSCFVNPIEIGMLKNILAPELRAIRLVSYHASFHPVFESNMSAGR